MSRNGERLAAGDEARPCGAGGVAPIEAERDRVAIRVCGRGFEGDRNTDDAGTRAGDDRHGWSFVGQVAGGTHQNSRADCGGGECQCSLANSRERPVDAVFHGTRIAADTQVSNAADGRMSFAIDDCRLPMAFQHTGEGHSEDPDEVRDQIIEIRLQNCGRKRSTAAAVPQSSSTRKTMDEMIVG